MTKPKLGKLWKDEGDRGGDALGQLSEIITLQANLALGTTPSWCCLFSPIEIEETREFVSILLTSDPLDDGHYAFVWIVQAIDQHADRISCSERSIAHGNDEDSR